MVHSRVLPFFVYGTLMPGRENYPHFLRGKTRAEEQATLTAAVLYTDGRYPYLVLESAFVQPSDCVTGWLITVKPHMYATVLTAIDGLERYQAGSNHNWYERVICQVETQGGLVDAWTYRAGTQALLSLRLGSMRRFGGTW